MAPTLFAYGTTPGRVGRGASHPAVDADTTVGAANDAHLRRRPLDAPDLRPAGPLGRWRVSSGACPRHSPRRLLRDEPWSGRLGRVPALLDARRGQAAGSGAACSSSATSWWTRSIGSRSPGHDLFRELGRLFTRQLC